MSKTYKRERLGGSYRPLQQWQQVRLCKDRDKTSDDQFVMSRDSYGYWFLILLNLRNLSADWLLTGKGEMLSDESINKVSQHVTGSNNTFAGRDLTTSTVDHLSWLLWPISINYTRTDLHNQQSAKPQSATANDDLLSEVNVSRQEQDISLPLRHKSDQN